MNKDQIYLFLCTRINLHYFIRITHAIFHFELKSELYFVILEFISVMMPHFTKCNDSYYIPSIFRPASDTNLKISVEVVCIVSNNSPPPLGSSSGGLMPGT